MKRLQVLWACVVMIGLAGSAWAAEAKPPHKLTSQQNRMKTCAAQYHEKKIPKSGYRAFMKQCLRTKPPKDAASPLKK